MDALREAEKYGLDGEGVVSAHRFNYLLSQLYKAEDVDGECVAMGRCVLLIFACFVVSSS